MRHKQLLFSALLLLGLGLTEMQAQTMYVKESSGTQTAYTLSDVRKMTFSGGNAVVQKTDNSSDFYPLSQLRYVSFTDYTASILEPTLKLESNNMIAFPNPVSDILNIDLNGLANEGTLSILSLDGKMLLEQKINGANMTTVNLCQLPQGIYLCRYISATEIKTVKIIKQ